MVKFLYKWRANLILTFVDPWWPDRMISKLQYQSRKLRQYNEWQKSIEQYVQHRFNRRLDQTSNINMIMNSNEPLTIDMGSDANDDECWRGNADPVDQRLINASWA